MSKRHDNELELPQKVLNDPDAKESLRLWLCSDGKVAVNSRKKICNQEELSDFFILLAIGVAMHDMFSFADSETPD